MTSETSSKTNSKPPKVSIWWAKYRPKTLDDLCLPKSTREKITADFTSEIPNLLLCGPPGTGKTTLAKILVEDVLQCDYLYINASDENGIDNIRNKVSGFAQTKSLDGGIKVVILDEADFLSASAMAALRNTTESYLEYTRFILTGNYKHKIIPAIQSRCRTIDIQPSFRDVVKRCLFILSEEKIEIPSSQKPLLLDLIKSNYPDFRKCIEALQDNCVDGKLSIGHKNDSSILYGTIMEHVSGKKVLELRKYLIDNDELFGGDHEQLLHGLLNYIYGAVLDSGVKKAMILTVADHIYKMSAVSDKEINCFACLLSLESI